MESLKRALRGMFKRSKKDKSETQREPQTAVNQVPRHQQQQLQQPTAQQQSPLRPSQPTGTPSKAPQLPPLKNSSPLESGTDTSKPLPPTHPLATGEHRRPQEAIPQSRNARPGPPAGTAVSSGANGANRLKEQEHEHDGVSSIGPASAVDGRRSDAISAVEDDSPPQPPPKTDSGLETKTEEPAGMSLQATDVGYMLTKEVTDSRPATADAKENAQPNGIAAGSSPMTNGTPTSATTNTEQSTTNSAPVEHTSNPSSYDEKIPVTMEEPPPIKEVRAMPGMSATSGPLEDFPEGEFQYQ